jgi:hypothetical protein
MVYRKLISRLLLSAAALSLLGAKGCTVDGDASLGNDGDSEPTATAGASASTAGTAGKTTQTPSASAGTSASTAAGGAAAGEPGVGEGVAGEPAQPTAGAPSTGHDFCALALDTGPCKGNLPRYGFDAEAGHCQLFTYGGCEGNANNFATLTECQGVCGDAPTCPSFLQTSLVYEVAPLNRPERACVVFANPLHVGCSELLNPSLTVPTDWPTHPCATRAGKLYRAGTTLPKAEGWQDCSAYENELVAGAPDCADLN